MGKEIHLGNLKSFIETRSGLHNGRSLILLVCMGGSKPGSLLCSFGLCAIQIILMSGELH